MGAGDIGDESAARGLTRHEHFASKQSTIHLLVCHRAELAGTGSLCGSS